MKNNKVDNCTISGYLDDSKPTTTAWVNNTALLNGENDCANYAIVWPNKKPQVDKGTIGDFAKHTNKYNNLSLVQAAPCAKKAIKKSKKA